MERERQREFTRAWGPKITEDPHRLGGKAAVC